MMHLISASDPKDSQDVHGFRFNPYYMATTSSRGYTIPLRVIVFKEVCSFIKKYFSMRDRALDNPSITPPSPSDLNDVQSYAYKTYEEVRLACKELMERKFRTMAVQIFGIDTDMVMHDLITPQALETMRAARATAGRVRCNIAKLFLAERRPWAELGAVAVSQSNCGFGYGAVIDVDLLKNEGVFHGDTHVLARPSVIISRSKFTIRAVASNRTLRKVSTCH
jgi:hypothetical protein